MILEELRIGYDDGPGGLCLCRSGIQLQENPAAGAEDAQLVTISSSHSSVDNLEVNFDRDQVR